MMHFVSRVDHLYTFFVQWSPDKCTKDNKKHSPLCYLIKKTHQNQYLVVDKNKVAVIHNLLSNHVNPTAKKWEMWYCRAKSLREKSEAMTLLPDNIKVLYFASHCVEPYVQIITVKDSKRRMSLCSSDDSEAEGSEGQEESEYIFPVLSDHSQVLDDQHLESLAPHMPAKTEGYPWQLVYSTAVHGSSLRTLYRNMAGMDSPVLLVIKDMHNKVFGAFSSDPFRVSNCCYGTGETFLFSFGPDFKAYKWSGENFYFVRGHLESLQIGAGGGGFGLWLDADLYRGSSYSCPTFQNVPLSTQQDFIVQYLEVWIIQN
ncbi:hypothetical protein LDENG_00047280 [Lucifuga dentata]|nr:hypothetical protein LDENG_00047280 [Lucifuga dentata]